MVSNEDREAKATLWLQRLQEAAASKESLVDYTRRHGLKPGEAYRWKQELRREGRWPAHASSAAKMPIVSPRKANVMACVQLTVMVLSCCFTAQVSGARTDGLTSTMRFSEKTPNANFVKAFSTQLDRARFLRLKFAQEGEGQRNAQQIRQYWAYSATENCRGPCSRLTSMIPVRLKTARRIDEACWTPYVMAIELLDVSEKVLSTFAFSGGGICFESEGLYYGLTPDNAIEKGQLADLFSEIFLDAGN